MDGRLHSRIFFYTMLFWIPLFIWMKAYLYIPLLILSNSIVDSDEDQKWMGGKFHRSLITHSLIWPLVIGFAIYLPFQTSGVSFTFTFIVCCIPVMVHLFLDLFSKGDDGKWHLFHSRDKGKFKIGKIEYTRLFIIANIITGIILIYLGFVYFL